MFGEFFNFFLNAVSQIFNTFKTFRIMGNFTYFDFIVACLLVVVLFKIINLLRGSDKE